MNKNIDFSLDEAFMSRTQSQLIFGDSTKPDLLPKESVNLIVTSPPYNLGKAYSGDSTDDSLDYDEYLEFSRKWLTNCFNWAKSTGRLCVNIGLDINKNGRHPLCADLTQLAIKAGWKYHTTIIWNESNISKRTAWGSWQSASAPHVIAPVEVIVVLFKDEWKRIKPGKSTISRNDFMEWTNGLWRFNGESAKKIGHEAPYPVELPRRCIQLFSYKNDVVLDPFVGSGSTLLAATDCERTGIGIEKEWGYCQLAIKRLGVGLISKISQSTPTSWLID